MIPLIKSRSPFLPIRFTLANVAFLLHSRRSSTSYVVRSSLRKHCRRRRKVNGVASDVLFTALLQSQLVAYPATSHRLRRFLHPLPLFRDPGFLRGSSTSARRTVKSQPLATSAEVPLAASFHPLDVPSSWFFTPFLPVSFLPRLADAFFPRVVNSHSRKIGDSNRIVKRKSDADREKLRQLLATCRTNNPAFVSGRCHLCYDPDLSFSYLSPFLKTLFFFFFFQKQDRRSMSDKVYSTARHQT